MLSPKIFPVLSRDAAADNERQSLKQVEEPYSRHMVTAALM